MGTRLQILDYEALWKSAICNLKFLREGQRTKERRAGALGAGGPDTAAVPFDQMLGDRQAQAGAAVVAGARPIDLIEALEDPRQVIGRDADPAVGDRHQQPVAGG